MSSTLWSERTEERESVDRPPLRDLSREGKGEEGAEERGELEALGLINSFINPFTIQFLVKS